MATRLITLALAAAAATASPLSSVQKRAAATVYDRCTQPGVVALTFDDGPYMFTSDVVDQFDAAGFHATFFVNGDNFATLAEYADGVRDAVASGHQIGSHT